jgi:Helix-turn-helix domain
MERASVSTRDKGMTLDEVRALPASIDLVTAGKALGIGRTLAHDLARRGQFPVRVLRLGNRYRVPTAEVLRFLGAAEQPAPAA